MMTLLLLGLRAAKISCGKFGGNFPESHFCVKWIARQMRLWLPQQPGDPTDIIAVALPSQQ